LEPSFELAALFRLLVELATLDSVLVGGASLLVVEVVKVPLGMMDEESLSTFHGE
jgi:hypothetical protein